MIPVIITAGLIKAEFIRAVCLSVAVKKFGTAVCMVVSLEYNIHVVLIKYRGQLGTQDHTIRIGMIQTGAVDILVNGDDAPFCIREVLYRLLYGLLVLRYIIIIGI